MERSWLAILAQIVFWVVAMTLMTRWMARSRLRDDIDGDGMQLRHPAPTLCIGLAATMFSVGVFMAAFTWAEDLAVLFAGVLFGTGMVALSLSLVADYYLARHRVDAHGMHYGRMSGQRSAFAWSEVQRVNFSEGMNWYRITLQSGATVRVSGLMMGLPVFASHVLEHVPANRIDATARGKLDDAAQGKLHRLWLF